MDQATLVSSGHALVKALDKADFAPRFAMWVRAADVETWKLWIVPPEGMKDRFEFYRHLAEVVAKNRNTLGDLSAGDVEFVQESHPGVAGIKQIIYAPGLGSAHFAGNRFNNFYLPEGILLRSAFDRRAAPRS